MQCGRHLVVTQDCPGKWLTGGLLVALIDENVGGFFDDLASMESFQ